MTATTPESVAPPVPPGEPEDAREVVEDKVRRNVMYSTLAIFAFTVAVACITGIWFGKPDAHRVLAEKTPEDRRLAREIEDAPFDHLKQILQILLPAETALLGSATGFYFAKSK